MRYIIIDERYQTEILTKKELLENFGTKNKKEILKENKNIKNVEIYRENNGCFIKENL